eukprot:2445602-Rhodomonas_salina.1
MTMKRRAGQPRSRTFCNEGFEDRYGGEVILLADPSEENHSAEDRREFSAESPLCRPDRMCEGTHRKEPFCPMTRDSTRRYGRTQHRMACRWKAQSFAVLLTCAILHICDGIAGDRDVGTFTIAISGESQFDLEFEVPGITTDLTGYAAQIIWQYNGVPMSLII